MIIDDLRNAHLYYSIHPGFKRTFELLQSLNPDKMALGRYELDGDKLFYMLSEDLPNFKPPRLEAHRKYIDVQVALKGRFEIGYRCLKEDLKSDVAYDSDKDIEFFSDSPSFMATIEGARFAILLPEDGHAPMAPKEGKLLKVVVKVRV